MAPIVAHSVNPFLFSTGSWVYTQIKTLSRWRAIVVAKRRENRDDYPLENVYALTDLSMLRQLRERFGRRRHGYFPFMRAAMRQHDARLMHSHFASQGWIDLPLAAASGRAHLTSFYGADIWKNSRSPQWRERYLDLFARGTCFLVEGNAMRAKVESLGCPREKIVIQHLGVDVERAAFAPRTLAVDGLVRILASGRAVEKKGHEFAVRAFARARREHPSLRLSLMIIAASEDERARLEALKALVRSEGVSEFVDFPPPRSYADYRKSLYDYHAFFAPSMHAENGDAEGGAPVSVIDMSATGMPIIASRHCDIPEVAPHGVSGVLFDESDMDAAVAGLLEVAGEPQRWLEWGRAGRAHVEREYSLSTQPARLEAIYDRFGALHEPAKSAQSATPVRP